MEMISFMIVLLFVAGCTILYVGFKLMNSIWFEPKRIEKKLQQQGLKGNPYRLFYGDIKDMKKMLREARSKPINGFSNAIEHRVLPLHQHALQKYGKNSYVWLGPSAQVIVMDPQLVKEVTLKHTLFQKPDSNPLVYLFIRGLATYETDKWEKHRKIINTAFQQDKLKNMLPAFHTTAMEMVNKWDELVSQKGSKEVDVWPDLQALSSDAISRTAFGCNFEHGKRILELQREQAGLAILAMQSVYIPGWRFLPTKMNRRMKSIYKDVNNSIMMIINERIKAMKEGKACEDDLLGELLESNFKEMDNHGKKGVSLSIQDVIEECKLFYLAGQESTATLLVWTMVLLSKYPNWQTLAREEVLKHFGTEKPDYDGLHHLKIVNMIFNEVLRLYPSAITMTRKSMQEIKLGKITLPAGTLISIPIILLHRDTETWGEDALEFKPERFAEGISNATKGQVTFIPFSWGPRICIGQNFALLEAKLAFALILQRFSFELSPSYAHAPISIMTLTPQHGAHLILHKI